MKTCLVLLLLLGVGCGYFVGKRAAPRKVASKSGYDVTADPKANRTISSADWKVEVLDSKEPVLVDFWAPWCGYCMEMMDDVEKLAKEVKIVRVNVDNNPELVKRYKIGPIPHLFLFQNGKVATQFVGQTSEHDLRQGIALARAKA